MSFCPANVLPEQNLTTGSMSFAYIIPGLETEGTQDVCTSSSWKKMWWLCQCCYCPLINNNINNINQVSTAELRVLLWLCQIKIFCTCASLTYRCQTLAALQWIKVSQIIRTQNLANMNVNGEKHASPRMHPWAGLVVHYDYLTTTTV